MKLSNRFLDAHNKMERYLKEYNSNNNYTPFIELVENSINNPIIKKYKRELISFGNLRNAIVHTQDRKTEYTIAEPHQEVVIMYEKIVEELSNPPLALNKYATKFNDLTTFRLKDSVTETLRIMNQNAFTQVLILNDDNSLYGIFSENTLSSYLADKELIIENETLIEEFMDYLPLNNHLGEYYIFAPKNITIYEVENIFREKSFRDNKYLSCIFLTHNGKENEKILGIVTPWDIFYKYNNK